MKASHIARAGLLALAVAATSCSSAVRQGTGSSFLIINDLQALGISDGGKRFFKTL